MARLSINDYKSAVRKLGLKSKSSFSTLDQAQFCCPFHNDTNPSMGINFKKGVYNCLSCNHSGTIGDMVRELTGITIKKYLGLEDDIDIFNPVLLEEEQVKTIPTLDIRGRFYPYRYSEMAMNYVKMRGIDFTTADLMQFQYCAEAYINTIHFVNRLMIPVYDENHSYLNVEGRALNTTEKKCLYPKGAIKPLYEWYKLDRTKPLYIVEGIIKLAVLRSDPFFTNSTTTMGSKYSSWQLEQMNEYTNIVLIRDIDDAGMEMAIKLKSEYKGNFAVWDLNNDLIKDVDEIPSILNTTVEKFRLNDGFNINMSFI